MFWKNKKPVKTYQDLERENKEYFFELMGDSDQDLGGLFWMIHERTVLKSDNPMVLFGEIVTWYKPDRNLHDQSYMFYETIRELL